MGKIEGGESTRNRGKALGGILMRTHSPLILAIFLAISALPNRAQAQANPNSNPAPSPPTAESDGSLYTRRRWRVWIALAFGLMLGGQPEMAVPLCSLLWGEPSQCELAGGEKTKSGGRAGVGCSLREQIRPTDRRALPAEIVPPRTTSAGHR